jgi:hypothetical protein
MSRLRYAMSAVRSSYGPTQQHREQFGYAVEGVDAVIKRLSVLQQNAMPTLQQAIIKAGGPWTTGAPVIE